MLGAAYFQTSVMIWILATPLQSHWFYWSHPVFLLERLVIRIEPWTFFLWLIQKYLCKDSLSFHCGFFPHSERRNEIAVSKAAQWLKIIYVWPAGWMTVLSVLGGKQSYGQMQDGWWEWRWVKWKFPELQRKQNSNRWDSVALSCSQHWKHEPCVKYSSVLENKMLILSSRKKLLIFWCEEKKNNWE